LTGRAGVERGALYPVRGGGERRARCRRHGGNARRGQRGVDGVL